MTTSFNGIERKILVSRLLTRSGDQAWDFAIPITLIGLFPNQLSLVAFLYLLSKLASIIIQPVLSSVIDRWQRLRTASLGIGLQLGSVLLVSFCLMQLTLKADTAVSLWSQAYLWPLLLGVSVGSVISNLGSGLMDIAVGNDWIPAAVAPENLSKMNKALQRLDLLTEVLSPVIAGLILTAFGSEQRILGFALIAAWNVISFFPEILLLRSVFLSSSSLQAQTTRLAAGARLSLLEKFSFGWKQFASQPIAPAMIAYSLLWLSALSPHGVLLTSFLKSGWQMPETALGIFRGLGAVFGLLATLFFSRLRRHLSLVATARFFIVFQALTLLLGLPFFYLETANGWIFLSLILLSRIGLYGFSLGETEIRQRHIAEGLRGQVNGVANALNSCATLVLYALGSLLSERENFSVMVVFSVSAVSAGALIFTLWSQTHERSKGNFSEP